MKTTAALCLMVCVGFISHFASSHARAAGAAASQPQSAKVRIVLVGDSTVAERSGWGPGFKTLLTDKAECINTAIGGRSSKSFRDEGHWDKAVALNGNYVFIQFGHNDEKGKGPERETEPDTTYTENMSRYIDEVRAVGGHPILVTSLVRRLFNADGKLPDTNLTRYVRAVRKLAEEKKVPLIDLYALSVAYFEKVGPAAANLCGPTDPKTNKPDLTHLNDHGSKIISALVAQETLKVLPDLAPLFNPTAIQAALQN